MGPSPDENSPRDRRTVRLELITYATVESDLPIATARTGCGVRHVWVSRDGWLCLAERALGDWPTTLRVALLMLVGFTGTIVLIGVAFGLGGLVLGAFLSIVYMLVLRVPGLLTAGRPSR